MRYKAKTGEEVMVLNGNPAIVAEEDLVLWNPGNGSAPSYVGHISEICPVGGITVEWNLMSGGVARNIQPIFTSTISFHAFEVMLSEGSLVIDHKLIHTGEGIVAPKRTGDVGYDLVVSQTTVVPAHGFANVPHDVCVELPAGLWAMIFARSSTNISGQIVCLPGVIDNGWRGQLFALCHNVSDDDYVVKAGTRICQLILFPMHTFDLYQVPILSPSDRGTGGFGSTGGHNGREYPESCDICLWSDASSMTNDPRCAGCPNNKDNANVNAAP